MCLANKEKRATVLGHGDTRTELRGFVSIRAPAGDDPNPADHASSVKTLLRE